MLDYVVFFFRPELEITTLSLSKQAQQNLTQLEKKYLSPEEFVVIMESYEVHNKTQKSVLLVLNGAKAEFWQKKNNNQSGLTPIVVFGQSETNFVSDKNQQTNQFSCRCSSSYQQGRMDCKSELSIKP